MGLLTSINDSTFPRSGVAKGAFLLGANITSLKEQATELLSGKPAGFINSKNWGSIGNFYFTTYKLPQNVRFQESDEYTEYSTFADFKEMEFKRQSNRTLSFNFMMKQRDTTQDVQNEEGIFEGDMLEMIDAIFAEKNKRIPLDLFFYSGKLYMGQYRIDSIDSQIIEFDSNGLPDSVEISLELTKYPRSQETGVGILSKNDYFRLKNV